jgi:hypothetical protein
LVGNGRYTPIVANGVAYDTEGWGSASALQSGASVSFIRDGNLDLNEGMLEM